MGKKKKKKTFFIQHFQRESFAHSVLKCFCHHKSQGKKNKWGCRTNESWENLDLLLLSTGYLFDNENIIINKWTATLDVLVSPSSCHTDTFSNPSQAPLQPPHPLLIPGGVVSFRITNLLIFCLFAFICSGAKTRTGFFFLHYYFLKKHEVNSKHHVPLLEPCFDRNAADPSHFKKMLVWLLKTFFPQDHQLLNQTGGINK